MTTDLKLLIMQAEDLLGDSTFTTLFRQQPFKSEGGEPIVYGWRGGERYALRLADGRFGQELYHALTAMSDVERNVFVSVLQIAQATLRRGVTMAPDFILSNIIRDQLSSSLTSGRRYIPFLSAMKGLGEIIRRGDDGKAYAGFGGLAGGALVHELERRKWGKSVTNVKSIVKGSLLAKIGQVFEASEGATRIGLFKSYRDQALGLGMDDYNAALYAAFKSQDYIDFRKAGASMGTVRRLIPFFNAAVQGTDREVRALGDLHLWAKSARGEKLSTTEGDRLKDAQVALVRLLGLGFILGTGTALLGAEDEDYQSASKHTKNSNFLIKTGDYWIAIPKPFGVVQSIVNAFEKGTEYAIRQDPSLIGDWLTASATAFAPPGHNPLVSLAYDLPSNYDHFRGKPIVPYYLQGVQPSEQYTPHTAELAKFLGQATGWSPMKIEYAIRNMGASLATDFLKSGDLVMGSDAPQKQIYDYPVFRRFMKNLARGSEATTAFYGLVGDKNGRFEQVENAYRVKIRNGERAGAEKFLRELPEDERAWTILSTQGFEAKHKRLHPMGNGRDHVSVINGLVAQLNSNNLVAEKDIDKMNSVRSHRDAEPIALSASTRAKAIEELQELSVAVARNAMVAIGAKGTKGLPLLNTDVQVERLKLISPELHEEYETRLGIKKVYDADEVRAAWPDVKGRLLKDGEAAELDDLVPFGANRRRRRRN